MLITLSRHQMINDLYVGHRRLSDERIIQLCKRNYIEEIRNRGVARKIFRTIPQQIQ